MTASVTADWTPVTKGVAQLVGGVESGSRRAALDQAQAVAAEIRSRTPVRTGALVASIGVVPEADGAGVTYGGGLRYARIIAARTDALAPVEDSVDRFAAAETEVAAQEVKRL